MTTAVKEKKLIPLYLKDIRRFYSQIKVCSSKECWEWRTPVPAGEYPAIKINGRRVRAHRYSYILHYRIYPGDKVVRHYICDNRICSNPSHLRLGTKLDNSRDMIEHGRSLKGTLRYNCDISDLQAVQIMRLRATTRLSTTKVVKLYLQDSPELLLTAEMVNNWELGERRPELISLYEQTYQTEYVQPTMQTLEQKKQTEADSILSYYE